MTAPIVLLVEDNAATRKLVRFVLEKEGYAVIEAATGAAALERMAADQPALVLQDLILPDTDGIELVQQLRRIPGGTEARILAFSGFVSQLDDVRISGAGFDDIVTKPIEPSRLLQVVSAHLPVRAVVTDRFGDGRRALVVDDEPVMLTLTRTHLARFGFEVATARDAASGLADARARRPDVIVSDVMMPDQDGYGLVLDIRDDPVLADVPVVLVTSSLVEEVDRDLARRAGASDLVVRTPDARELVASLRLALAAPPPRPTALPPDAELDRDRVSRIVRQLESHVLINSRLLQRSSALAAELRVLTGISEAVVRRRDVEATLDEALEACLDAGGVSVGALYRVVDGGALRVRAVGGDGALAEALASFFGHEELLRRLMTLRGPIAFPGPDVPAEVSDAVLARCGAGSALLVPLIHVETPIGALFMAGRHRDLRDDDWCAFALGVGHQITLALALAGAFSELETSRGKWRALVENAPDTVYQIDPAGRIQFINRVDPPLRRGEVLGQPWTTFASVEHHGLLDRTLAEVVASGEPRSVEILSGDGRWHSLMLGPVRAGADVVAAIAIARDITHKKQTEAQLIVSDRMASVGTLAAGVAHEINNPLAAVLANLELAQRDIARLALRTPVGELGELVREARDAADRVRQIVRDLRVFSRAEEEQHGPVDVRSVLESTLRIAGNEIRHRARLVRDFDEVPAVLGNESRLGQVFLNLVVNAAQAIPEGQAESNDITVRVRRGGQRVAIDVIDTGSGMSSEVMRRLFTPFFTTKPVGVGTGLGLSICQRIVSAMGGEIRVDSALGRGSTFTVLLPTAPEAGPGGEPLGPPPVRTLRRGRVLVIDDEPLIAVAVRRMLSDHDVVTVGRAEDALARLRSGERYDVILCDLMMPQVTGMDLYDQLAAELPELLQRVVFMTGGAFTVRARQFLDAVANARIEKPFDVQQLRSMVDERVG
jgi:PAS domain S-box-containing protein